MDLPVGNEGSLNGATAVVVLDAPAASKQRSVPASGLSIYQADTVPHDYTFQKHKGANTYIFLKVLAQAPGSSYVLAKKVVLDAADETLEVLTDVVATTTEPTWDIAAMESS